ncbi:MAG: hypothetical protein AMK69_16850 [Nitrospira bacterium SG8_3]|nr:MAG: hypothetical protein AMK69_16850 [Nitrospira bacterium SG8_3]
MPRTNPKVAQKKWQKVFKNINGSFLRFLQGILTNQLLVMSRKHQKKRPYFLPYGKAEYTPSQLNTA